MDGGSGPWAGSQGLRYGFLICGVITVPSQSSAVNASSTWQGITAVKYPLNAKYLNTLHKTAQIRYYCYSHFTTEGRESLRGGVITRYFDSGLSAHIIASRCLTLGGIPSVGAEKNDRYTNSTEAPWLMAPPFTGHVLRLGCQLLPVVYMQGQTASAAYFFLYQAKDCIKQSFSLYFSCSQD